MELLIVSVGLLAALQVDELREHRAAGAAHVNAPLQAGEIIDGFATAFTGRKAHTAAGWA